MTKSSAGAASAVGWIKVGRGCLTVTLSVRPQSSRPGVLRIDSERGPVIGLRSAPEHGRANLELVEYLAELWRLPKSALRVVRGASSRHKVVRIEGADPAKIASALEGRV